MRSPTRSKPSQHLMPTHAAEGFNHAQDQTCRFLTVTDQNREYPRSGNPMGLCELNRMTIQYMSEVQNAR